MKSTKLYTENYTTGQMVFPLETGYKFPEDSDLMTFCELMKGIDLDKYFEENRIGRKRKDRVAILKTILFGFMSGIRSTRNIKIACNYDIRFMYLLGGETSPSHTTINNTLNEVKDVIDSLFLDVINSIRERDEIDLNTTFIDGTKIEADANRYSFVWRKSVEKNLEKLKQKISIAVKNSDFLAESHKNKSNYKSEDVEVLFRAIANIAESEKTNFVSGKGHKKSKIQREYEKFDEYFKKIVEYENHLNVMGPNRNSYSKSDHDATFMRMKTDHMRNGQLKAGYNVQLAVNNEYITCVDVMANRSDHKTFEPFMNKFFLLHNLYPKYPVADAGYGSYDNYYFCKMNGMELYQKYGMWSKESTKKFKKNIYHQQNLQLLDNGNYLCPNNKELVLEREYTSKRLQYPNLIKSFICRECSKCSLKSKCTKAKGNREIHVNEAFNDFKKEVRKNLSSSNGIELRIQRSIQVEGAFGVIKEDMKFRRFTRISKTSVLLELSLIAIGYNLRKFHRKKQRNNSILH